MKTVLVGMVISIIKIRRVRRQYPAVFCFMAPLGSLRDISPQYAIEYLLHWPVHKFNKIALRNTCAHQIMHEMGGSSCIVAFVIVIEVIISAFIAHHYG